MSDRPGRLTLVAGPIGNLSDLSPRAVAAIEAADVVIAEDTRVTGKLLAHLGHKKETRLLNEHTTPASKDKLAQEILAEKNWVLLTDAGTPGISDPGADLVDQLLDLGAEVDCVPGPSAVTNAIALSGFFAQRFTFLGFMPRKPGPIAELLLPYQTSSQTLVFFESPHRFRKLLEESFKTLGQRRYAICREMTKMHQQVYRGVLPAVPTEKEVPAKGEFTLVIEGARRSTVSSDRL